ncbi:helix-turn-helix domain-containing protein [Clostridium tyrobutyricum]|uniref:helix-turn-helix domain-containing protein n=1 Tax=Clostridium tyrobutyricum TaxID=1519 RepID=UPI0011CC7E46|nr:XRE family transcriptional regulator [Clostridium tyrobutyricum]
MEDLNSLIATNFKRIREDRKLSLDKVSELTGISKSMLGQIERGKSNPSVTTISKIAYGLRIQVDKLITTPKANTTVIHKINVKPLIEDDGKYKLYPFFSYEDGRYFEIYTLEIEKSGYLKTDAHIDGTEEFLTIFRGEITIKVDNEKYILKDGDSIRFKADRPHSYRNTGCTLAEIDLIVYHHP